MHVFYLDDSSLDANYLTPEESQHCVGVLRKTTGDAITIYNGKGWIVEAVITHPNKKKCGFAIQTKRHIEKSTPFVHLAIAPTKNMDRMEWLVEKLQEMGVDRLSFVTTKNSERKVLKTDRLWKKAISAMKQSKNPHLISIDEMQPMSTFLKNELSEQKLIAHLNDTASPIQQHLSANQNSTLLIGPEGDFTVEEVAQSEKCGFRSVSLGDHVLRTETAGLVGCTLLSFFKG